MPILGTKRKLKRSPGRNNAFICLAVILIEMAGNQLFLESEWLILPMNITILGLILLAIYRGWNQDIALAFALFYWIQLITVPMLLPTDIPSILLLILSCTIYWLIQRPTFKSEDIGQNMGVAFYQGDNTPWIARIASLFTFKAHSVAMVYQDKAMVPTGKGIVKCVDKSSLGPDWTIFDTGRQPPDLGIHYFNDMKGAPVTTYGCVKASKYVLQEIGIEPSPVPGFIQRNLLNGRR